MLSPGQDLFEYRIICLLGQGRLVSSAGTKDCPDERPTPWPVH